MVSATIIIDWLYHRHPLPPFINTINIIINDLFGPTLETCSNVCWQWSSSAISELTRLFCVLSFSSILFLASVMATLSSWSSCNETSMLTGGSLAPDSGESGSAGRLRGRIPGMNHHAGTDTSQARREVNTAKMTHQYITASEAIS